HRAQVRTAQVVVGGDVDHPRARTESDRRPVLATVDAGTEVRALPRHWLLLWVDVGFTRHRIEAAEDVLIHERFPLDKRDWTRTALEEPDVPVTRDIDQALDGSSIALVVDEDRR